MKKLFLQAAVMLLTVFVFTGCASTPVEENTSAKNGKNQVPVLTLNNGVEMPQFGLGTFMLDDKNGEAYNSVLTALKLGYRHIDTAHAYQNERSVGRAIKDSGVPREEIWVTSKLWPTDYNDEKALDKMLERLGLEYLDLVYVHQPIGDYMAAWNLLAKAQKEGKVRALGLSNFDRTEDLFDSFMAQAEVKPQIMQLECHPYAQRLHWQKKLKENNMKQENWFPLGGRVSQGAILKNETIVKIANAKGKSPAQIVIRWHIQEGFSVIPGASNPDYIKENIEVFDFSLTEEEMREIRALNTESLFFTTSMEKLKSYMNVDLKDW